MLESKLFIYVDALQSLTQVTTAASVNCLLVPWELTALLTESIKTFFFECLGEQGAPESAFTISSSTFWKNIQSMF